VSVESVLPCDLVLLLMGHELGTRSAQGESFTEAEFRTARRNGIPVIAFLLDEGAKGLHPDPTPGPGAAEEKHGDRERQRQFRADVRAYAKIVEGPKVPLGKTGQLADEVVKKLNEWLKHGARPHLVTERNHSDTIFVGRGEPYRQLKKRVLAGQTSVVSGGSGAGKSMLVDAVSGDLDVTRGYPRPAVIADVVLDLKTAAPFDPSTSGLTQDPPPGTRDLLIVRMSSVLSQPRDVEHAVADFIASFPAEDLLARRCTTIFELTDAAAAEGICHCLRIKGARAHIRLQGLSVEASQDLLLVSQGLHEEECSTCDRYGPRVAAAAGYWPPLLDVLGRRLALLPTWPKRHSHMRDIDKDLRTLRPGEDPMYKTFSRELESLDPDPRRVLDVASVLLPEPVGFSLGLITEVTGLPRDAAEGALETLVNRGYIKPAAARPGPEADPDPDPDYLIHPFFWAFLQLARASAPGADQGAGEKKQLRQDAFDWLEKHVNETFDEELSYGGWTKLEKPERQELLANWIYQLAHADDRRKAAEALARLYLKALWWWGYYLPFSFCDLLIALGHKAVEWSSPAGQANGDDLYAVVRSLDGLHESCPRLGQYFDAPPEVSAARTAWEQTGQALRELARRLEVPVDDEVEAARDWVPAAGQTDDDTAYKAARLRDIAMFVHAFLADCEQCWYGEKAIDDRRLAEVERHLESAVAISEEPDDEWNRSWFQFFLGGAELTAACVRHQSPAGYRRREATCLRKARGYAEKALAGARKLAEDVSNLDFELLASSERLLGDIDWHMGHRADAIDHYARAVHYAHCFELWPPHQPDLYTWTFEREQRQRVVTPLSELASAGSEDEARHLADRFAAFFGTESQSGAANARAQTEAPAPLDRAESRAESRAVALQGTLFLPYHLPSRGDLPRQDQLARRTIERFCEEEREMIHSVEGRHPDLDLVRLPKRLS